MDQNEVLGTGWAFPPKFHKHSNGVEMLTGEEDIESSIYVILHTKLGERILRDEFGSDIHELLFEPLNENMKTYMASSLKKSLINNEPRITVENITLAQKDPNLGRVDILITYKLIETNKTQNLVVPFYSIAAQ
ncbi:GPW/gp25 family protein [Aquimarina longa]|uniref:GPW/gp25 family protein n=1 Tax=Aquimarina longa TaxID=1080221 RepID=UPI0007852E34|nr:GPW/gp25 family protein [Aquimarina longa]